MKSLFLSLILVSSGVAAAKDVVPESKESRWLGGIEYSLSTDLAETITPRTYQHGLNGELGYSLSKKWNLSLTLDLLFSSSAGKIEKKEEETIYETLGANPGLGVQYGDANSDGNWTFLGRFMVPGDALSRREGYLGIGILSTAYKSSFLSGKWTMANTLSLMEVFNSYSVSTWGTANPGTSVSYKMSHSLQVYKQINIIYIFGFKQTRYLDGYWDYSFNNIFGLGLNGDNWNVTLSSNEGGFTDQGHVQFWFLDEYRRIVMLTVGLQF